MASDPYRVVREAGWREPVYLDASALVKLIVDEPESDALNDALREAREVIVSDLALTEAASALGRRRREGRLSAAEATRLYGVAERLATRSARSVETTPPVHRRAERLLLTSRAPLRALEALHLALAVDVEAATLVTYDARLAEAAVAHGLVVVPAEDA